MMNLLFHIYKTMERKCRILYSLLYLKSKDNIWLENATVNIIRILSLLK